MSDTPKFVPATPLNPRRRAILVGASVGMGAALARKLAKEGYAIALIARQKDKLDALCAEINQSLGETRAFAYPHDVINYDEVPNLLQEIIADLGGLDTFILMAGVNYPPGGNDKFNFENDRKMVEVNLIGAMAWLSRSRGGRQCAAARAGCSVRWHCSARRGRGSFARLRPSWRDRYRQGRRAHPG